MYKIRLFCYMDNRMLITVGKSFDYCQQACWLLSVNLLTVIKRYGCPMQN